MKIDLYKYPKTKHLPWSLGQTRDDKTATIQELLQNLSGKDIVITEKLDGENSSLYPESFHARSLDSRNHPSRNWLRKLHGSIKNDIPSRWRICGENLFAKHTILYKSLPSYFFVFVIFNDKNICISWDETVKWCALLGLSHVPVLYRGIFDIDKIKECYSTKSVFLGSDCREGYVVRNTAEIPFEEYPNSIYKFVRKDHVQTDEHWMDKEIIRNELLTDI